SHPAGRQLSGHGGVFGHRVGVARGETAFDFQTGTERRRMNDKKTIGIVGARGHTGAELIRMLATHPSLELVFVSSRELDGQRVADHNEAYEGGLRYENLEPQAVADKHADVVILA